MTVCAIKWCHNTPERQRKGDNNVTFHRFPSDKTLRKKWTEIVQETRPDGFWKPSSISVICSAHFKDEELYQTSKGLRRVRRGAVPSNTQAETPLTNNASTKKSSKFDINLDADPSDSPIVTKLKSRLREREKTCKKYALRIKSLQRKNDRLNKTNIRLNTVINVLKNKASDEDGYISETMLSITLTEE